MNEPKQFRLASRKNGGRLGGVLGGIANTFGFDAGTLRLLYALCTVAGIFCYGVGFAGIPLYLVTWAILALVYGYDD